LAAGARGSHLDARGAQTLNEARDQPFLVLYQQHPDHAAPPLLGTTSVNVDPSPRTDLSTSLPPCAAAMALAMGSPSPAPSAVASTRLNRSSTRSWSAAAIPWPSSRTQR